MFLSHQGDVGRTILSTTATLGTLGFRMLQVPVRWWITTYLGKYLECQKLTIKYHHSWYSGMCDISVYKQFF